MAFFLARKLGKRGATPYTPVMVRRDGEEKRLGRVYTPPWLVEFMVSLAEVRRGARVLEPGAAHAPFLERIWTLHGQGVVLEGVELDGEALPEGSTPFPVHREDFLLWSPPAPYDLVVGNPPYGIVGDGSKYPLSHGLLRERKALYRQHLRTWRGKYNLYGAFLERGVEVLAPQGQMVMVVPASWLLLPDFALLRRYLAERGKSRVFYLGEAFGGRKVRVVVLDFRKGGRGLELWDAEGVSRGHPPSLEEVFPEWRGEAVAFPAPPPARGRPLGEAFAVRVATRSPQFRREGVYPYPRPGTLPVLTGRNLAPGHIDYERNYSGLWVEPALIPLLHPYYALPHLVVGATRGTRVVAAWDRGGYPWREEYHLLPLGRYRGPELLEYLNSPEVNGYLRRRYRDMVPRLTREMLASLPLPD